MSKKRRSSRGSSKAPDAAVHLPLDDVCRALEGTDELTCMPVLDVATTRILELIRTKSTERRALARKSSRGTEILLACLKRKYPHSVVRNILETFLCLCDYKHSTKLINQGALDALLLSHTHSCKTIDLALIYFKLLLKLAHRDRKFPIKARLNGLLPVTVNLLKRSLNDPNVVSVMLSVVKVMASNATNCMSLGRHGAIGLFPRLLSVYGSHDNKMLEHVLKTYNPLLSKKSNSSKKAVANSVAQLLVLFQKLHSIDGNGKRIALRKSIISTLSRMISADICLQAFHKARGLRIMWTIARELHEDSRCSFQVLSTSICSLLRKSLPLVSIPINAPHNPIPFPLSNVHTSIESPDSNNIQGGEANHTHSKSSLTDISESLSLVNLSGGAIETGCHDNETCKRNKSEPILSGNPQTPHPPSARGPPKSPTSWFISLDDQLDHTDNKRDLTPFDNFFPELCSSTHPTIIQSLSFPNLSSSFEQATPILRPSVSFSNAESALNEGGVLIRGGVSLLGNTSICTAPGLEEPTKMAISDCLRTQCKCGTVFDFSRESKTVYPLYRKTSAVERELLFQDVARFVEPDDIINKVVYDIEEHILSPSMSSLSSESIKPLDYTTTGSENEPIAHDVPGPSVNILEPNDTISRPMSNISGPSSAISEPSANISGPILNVSGPSMIISGPSPNISGPILNVSGPSSAIISGPSTNISGPNANIPGPVINPLNVTIPRPLADNISRPLDSNTTILPPFNDSLIFNSLSESCNLRKAIQVRSDEYDLVLNADINTDHHHQWFLFEVSNMVANRPYRMNIVNCEKPDSQSNYGMQPVLYSSVSCKWSRVGTNISYYKNNAVYRHPNGNSSTSEGSGGAGPVGVAKKREGVNGSKTKRFYTLAFTVTFHHDNDVCILAYHYPYTHTMMRHDILQMENHIRLNPPHRLYYDRRNLCHSLAGNSCPLITVTSTEPDPCHDEVGGANEAGMAPKEYIVLSGRVHPGETNSSWIMKGVLEYLISDDPIALGLRERFVFKLIPMLNPDGVCNGSHRCSLSGQDLNRQWISPDPTLHPTIYHTKGLIQWLIRNDKTPYLYCDFHGHSRKKNVFLFGCKNTPAIKELPLILSKATPLFSLHNCTFNVDKSKEATGRVVVWRMGVERSYTMESTYCGMDTPTPGGMQVQTDDLIEMGRSFCRALLRLSPTEDILLTDDDELVDTPSLMSEDNYRLHGNGETDEEGVSEGASSTSSDSGETS